MTDHERGIEAAKAEAFDRIVAARKRHVEAVAAYNARRELATAERMRGSWAIKLDTEYHAMSDAQTEFHRTVQDLCAAYLAITEPGKPESGVLAEAVKVKRVMDDPCIAKLKDDEPFFVLLGRDPDAAHALSTWFSYRVRREGRSSKTDAAEKTLDAFRAYRDGGTPPQPEAQGDNGWEAALAVAVKALEFYANPKNYIDSPSWDGDPECFTPKCIPVSAEETRHCDCGDIARAALNEVAK